MKCFKKRGMVLPKKAGCCSVFSAKVRTPGQRPSPCILTQTPNLSDSSFGTLSTLARGGKTPLYFELPAKKGLHELVLPCVCCEVKKSDLNIFHLVPVLHALREALLIAIYSDYTLAASALPPCSVNCRSNSTAHSALPASGSARTDK